MWPLLVVGLIVLWATYEGDGDLMEGAGDILSIITRGPRLTHAAYEQSTGVVSADPTDLAASAGLTEDQYALARMISSEEGTSSNLIKGAICWATINYAAKVGKSVTDLLLNAKDPRHAGHFGTFKNIDPLSPNYKTNAAGKPSAADRYASTALDPYTGDGQIACDVLDGTVADMTGGATQFDRPAGENDPDSVAAKREAAGCVAVAVDGIDPTVLRFWRS